MSFGSHNFETKYYLLEFDSQELSFLDQYQFIGFHLKENDNKYIIYSIKGMLDYDNDIDSCLKQKKIIIESIKDTLSDSKEEKYENSYGKLYGQSKAYISDFKVKDGFIRVWCNKWDKTQYGSCKKGIQVISNSCQNRAGTDNK